MGRQAVVARYKLALQLRPGWEKGYFCLGQYVDFLFKSRCSTEGELLLADARKLPACIV